MVLAETPCAIAAMRRRANWATVRVHWTMDGVAIDIGVVASIARTIVTRMGIMVMHPRLRLRHRRREQHQQRRDQDTNHAQCPPCRTKLAA